MTADYTACTDALADLRAHYLECLGLVSTQAKTLRHIIKALLELGTGWELLLVWAVEAGFGEKPVRKLLSEILCEMGIRRRRPGAGRQTPQEALSLLAHARSQYGELAYRYLRAAYRAAKSERAAQQQFAAAKAA